MKRKILLVSHSSKPSGAPRVIMDIAARLFREGRDLSLCVPEHGGIAQTAEETGIPVKIIPNPQKGVREGKNLSEKITILLKRLGFILKLRKELKNGSYDLVYINSSAAFYAGFALFGVKTRVIWHIHEDLNLTFFNRLKCRLIAKISNYLVFVSPSNIPCFSSFLKGKNYQVIPNGVLLEKFDRFTIDEEYRQRYNYKAGDRVVAMISFISKRKGVDIFLKALRYLLPESPRVKGVIAGEKANADPAYLEELEILSQEPELRDRVFFPGHCANIPSFLDSALIFALPSRNDPMPLVILEAMAAGKAIIAADVGCVREMLNPPYAGILVPPENPKAMGEEIQKLLNDPEQITKLGQNARQRARQHYSMETFHNKIRLLIETALE